MARLTTTVRGIGVLDQLWTPARIHSADTSLSEADPQPGTCSTTSTDARIVPQIVGVQSQGANVVVTRTGNPGAGVSSSLVVCGTYGVDGLQDALRAEVGYYLADGVETLDNLRGLDPPTKITDWRSPGAIVAADMADACVYPLSGKVALVWNAASNARFAIWNPYSEAFEHLQNLPAALDTKVSLAVIPGSERLLAIGVDKVGYSDDYGANWSLYTARGPGTVIPGAMVFDAKIRSAFDGQGNLCWIATDTSGGSTVVFGSSDLGGSWAYVSSETYTDWDMAAHPDGGLFFAYVDDDDHVQVARMEGAFSNPSTATPVPAFGDTYDGPVFEAARVWIGIDWNGSIWIYGEELANPGYWRVSVSVDGGGSFVERIAWPPIPTPYFWSAGGTDHGPGGWRLVANAAGGLVAAACWGPVGAGDDHGGLAKLGGWTSPQATARLFGGTIILGAGQDITGKMWIGYGRPQDVAGSNDYSYSGTATTTHSSADGSPISPLGYLKIDSTGAGLDGHYEGPLTDSGAVGAHGHFAVAVEDDGGSATVIGVKYLIDDVGTDVSAELGIFFTEDGFRVRDSAAGAWFGPKVDVNLTVRTWFAVVVSLAQETVDILYRPDGTMLWERVTYTSVSFVNSSTATDTAEVRWGHLNSGAVDAVSRWWVSQHSSVSSIAESPESDAEHHSGLDVFGVSCGSELGYPLPELHDNDAERMALLLMRGGVGVRGDTYSHDVLPGYPREALFPSVEPSPSRRWRSTGVGSNQSIVVDRGYDGRPNGEHSTVWLVAGANARRWRVAYKEDGGSSYTTAGTLDLATGFTSVGFSRYGDVVLPGSGGVGARYLWAGELAGGTVVLDLAGTPTPIRIKSNTPGFWDANATGPRATLLLEPGFDASTAPTSGAARIIWSSGIMVLHGDGSAGSYRRYWRVTCLDDNLSADGFYEAGLVAPFGLKVPGKRYGNGWEWSTEPNVRSSRDSYGTERRDQLGPDRRVLTLGWDHGAKLDRIRGKSDADYLGTVGGAPLVARDDVWQVLVDLWRQSKGGSLPVLALLTDPGDGETLTDPTLWLYAYLSGALRTQQATGEEGVAEFLRSGPVRLEEIV